MLNVWDIQQEQDHIPLENYLYCHLKTYRSTSEYATQWNNMVIFLNTQLDTITSYVGQYYWADNSYCIALSLTFTKILYQSGSLFLKSNGKMTTSEITHRLHYIYIYINHLWRILTTNKPRMKKQLSLTTSQ